MMTITYPVKSGLYINMTNRCPCACTFCLRSHSDSVYGSEPLWLDREPTVQEVCASIDGHDLGEFTEIVFCGYGEPAMRLPELIEVAKHIKKVCNLPIRINTNGLADLIWGEPTAGWLEGVIDTVSVSLNATDAESYNALVRPKFGLESYDAMLKFTADCVKHVPNVVMTVVDVVTTPEEQQRSREICESIGATLRVRPYEE